MKPILYINKEIEGCYTLDTITTELYFYHDSQPWEITKYDSLNYLQILKDMLCDYNMIKSMRG